VGRETRRVPLNVLVLKVDCVSFCRAGSPVPRRIEVMVIPPEDAQEEITTKFPKRKHLRRLSQIFEQWQAPLYYLTVCTKGRERVLANERVCRILADSWAEAGRSNNWMVGCYMVMPDHVHFFATPASRDHKSLSDFMGGWKSWTRRMIREFIPGFDWQKEFFDHLLRSEESYSEKWDYVRQNPVRAGLIGRTEDWAYQGELNKLGFR